MAQMDLERERQRLSALYASLQELELAEIAANPQLLTEVALQTLRAEMSRRGMEPIPEASIRPTTNPSDSELLKPVMIRRYRDLPEASIAKTILDSADIESFLFAEKTQKPRTNCSIKTSRRNSLSIAAGITSSRAALSANPLTYPMMD